MMQARDPRVDPRPGDVLTLGSNRVEVTERTSRRILYTLTVPAARMSINALPMHCGLYLSRWQMVVENAEVIHASE